MENNLIKLNEENQKSSVKSWKLNVYRSAAKYYNLYILLATFVLIILLILWLFPVRRSIYEGVLMANPFVFWPIFTAIVIIVSVLVWLFLSVWGWYNWLFRYIAYGVACLLGHVGKFCNYWWVKMILLLAFVVTVQYGRYKILGEKELQLSRFLQVNEIVKTMIVLMVTIIIIQMIKARKRIVIAEFGNYTGDKDKDKELSQTINGISPRIFNRLNRVADLLKTIDDIQPRGNMEVHKSSLNVFNLEKSLKYFSDPSATIEIGKFIKIPVQTVLSFFSAIARGPILTGSIHLNGEEIVLLAHLRGGGYNRSWEVCSHDIETQPASCGPKEMIAMMTDQLVCRIITDVKGGISTQWRAVRHYKEGLRIYRDSLTKRENKLKLMEAKKQFALALRYDSGFSQCYFNLGIIYKQLNNDDAAIAAFYEALKSDIKNVNSYYELGYLYYKKGDYMNALWFLGQSNFFTPDDTDPWNLTGIISYYQWKELQRNSSPPNTLPDTYDNNMKIPVQIIRDLQNATAIACRKLCCSIVKGEQTKKIQHTASVCIRNLAKITGNNKRYSSRFLFRQALCLAPGNNDIEFERGKYYYRFGTAKKSKYYNKAYRSFIKVFENNDIIGEPVTFWAYYLNTMCKLEYTENIRNKYVFFLGSISALIQKSEPLPDTLALDLKLVREALRKANEKDLAIQMAAIPELKKLFDNISRNYTAIRQYPGAFREWTTRDHSALLPKFWWLKTQLDIFLAKLILRKETGDEPLTHACKLLEMAIETFKNRPVCCKSLIHALYSYLAEGYLKTGQLDRALIYGSQAVRFTPYQHHARTILGRVYLQQKQFERAIIQLDISFNLGPGNYDTLAEIADTYLLYAKSRNDPVERRKLFEEAERNFSHMLAIIKDRPFDSGEAVDNPMAFIARLPSLHLKLGQCFTELLQYEKAIQHFKIALKTGANPLEVNRKCGWLYFTLQDSENALDYFGRAKNYLEKKENHRHTQIEISLGSTFALIEKEVFLSNGEQQDTIGSRLKVIKKQIEAIKRESVSEPLKSLYHECKGRFHQRRGLPEMALKEFEESLSHQARTRVYFSIARVYLFLLQRAVPADRQTIIEYCRRACILCSQTDLRRQFEDDILAILKELDHLKSTAP